MTNSVSIIIPTRNRCKLLAACLHSVYQSTYTDLEVIVFDNASSDDTETMVKNRYPSVRYVKSRDNLFMAPARNQGIKLAGGRYLLFIDDDNQVHPRMIEELIKLFRADPRVGMAGPKMYYRNGNNVIWWTGASIGLLTSRTVYRGLNEVDRGQYEQVSRTEHIPNVVMVKREVIEDIGGFNEEYQMSYSDSDFAMRAGAAGYKVMFCPRAITYHDVALPDKSSRPFKLPMRAYYFARNRVIYMKKFAPGINFFFFQAFFYPMFSAWYSLKLILVRDFPSLRMYLFGIADGYTYALTGKLRDYYRREAGNSVSQEHV